MMTIFFLIVALVPAVFIADGFIEQEVQAKGGFYRRDEEPRWYWATMGIYFALLAFLIYAAVDVAFI